MLLFGPEANPLKSIYKALYLQRECLEANGHRGDGVWGNKDKDVGTVHPEIEHPKVKPSGQVGEKEASRYACEFLTSASNWSPRSRSKIPLGGYNIMNIYIYEDHAELE